LPLLRTEVLVQLFPSMIDSPDFDELFAEQVDYNENDLIFMRRCLARQLWADGHVVGRSNGGANDKLLYVARPVGLTHRWQLLRKAFPQSKLLVMVRRPAESFADEARLIAETIGAAQSCDGDVGSSKRLNKLMASVYKVSGQLLWFRFAFAGHFFVSHSQNHVPARYFFLKVVLGTHVPNDPPIGQKSSRKRAHD
jgi:hypothetical protein